ncbi:SDR family oxidoreductase [Kribbella deserti]|uniref:SDR family oxidoreductase n=1 Tax=Kribbella deserti TaxID=1926257 RepID=A0ABV6QGF3_9ACTN
MPTTLITGANKGLGFETARQLVAAGHAVYIAARDPERGKAAADRLGARSVVLDVTSDESVRAAVAEIDHLDVLINNAGIPGSFVGPDEIDAAEMLTVYDTNVFGAIRVFQASLPLLRKSAAPVVVNVSSGLGSLAVTSDPEGNRAAVPDWMAAPVYASSKAALNMLTIQYARALPEFRINAVDPGFTATDLNGHRGVQTIEQGAEIIVRMARLGPDGPTGQYVSATGPVPW